MSNSPPSSSNCTTSFLGALDCGSGAADQDENLSIGALVAALAVSFASFGGQTILFALLRLKLTRIYQPRSYLVPERERVPPPPKGLIGWIYPLFTTTNLALIQKCGLDAYFFLRYLRMLLKIFLPLAIVLMPILIPINKTGGNAKLGLNVLSISNISPGNAHSKLWAHLVLAVITIIWVFYVAFTELRGYIRVRQAYLTSPQHRIRASATTVLVTGIPRKWLTLEALSGLYDVFPGGIRNIWINRDLQVLDQKVQDRHRAAKNLEMAETNLIKMCREKHQKAEKERVKKEGGGSKRHGKKERANEDAAADQMAKSPGMSAGAQDDIPQDLQDVSDKSKLQRGESQKRSAFHPFNTVAQGLGTAGHTIGDLGRGVGRLEQKVVNDLNRAADVANTGGAFATDDELYRNSITSPSSIPPTTPPKIELPRINTMASDTLGQQAISVPTQALPDTTPRTRHRFATSTSYSADFSDASPNGAISPDMPEIRQTRPSGESKPKSSMQIEEPPSHQAPRTIWDKLRPKDNSLVFPSPQPHIKEEDEFPLRVTKTGTSQQQPKQEEPKRTLTDKLAFWKSSKPEGDEVEEKYPTAINSELDEDKDGESLWRRYLEPKDRPTMRLPIFGQNWLSFLPFVGKKVDTIYHCRRELARLNLEIETDQNNVDDFPLMNSAFIQFNHQIAAHMCCQSLSHHVPQQMAPRTIEISPNDVLWGNLSIKWWERYLRFGVILFLALNLIIFYALPVSFTSLLANINQLSKQVPFLAWLDRAPNWIISIIQGVLPAVLISLILTLIPIIFRLLVHQQGVPTGSARELGVQIWYFTFLFIQVFFIVTLVDGLSNFFDSLAKNPTKIITGLATNLPAGSNYFFSYLTVQGLSNSASALLQVGGLFKWFIWAPMNDSTARQKWRRQTKLNNVNWGTFFPPFTNFAVIGLIYSVLAPFILIFMLLIFSLFWVVYYYNILHVYKFRHDTGGLLFPVAINQLFVGVYFLEICLIAIFFTLPSEQDGPKCIGQAVIMIVTLVVTIIVHWLMNSTFAPLYRYLPITLEDEAVIRDEEFARAQASQFEPLQSDQPATEDKTDIQKILAQRERQDQEDDELAAEKERKDIARRRQSRTLGVPEPSESAGNPASRPDSGQRRSWADRSESQQPEWNTQRWKHVAPEAVAQLRYLADGKPVRGNTNGDVEAQHTVGDILFSGFADELEDLTPDDRDLLVRYSFQHTALRARRPVVWIPRDKLGVSDDEIKRATRMSTVETTNSEGVKHKKPYIWMSNDGTALDGKGRVVFRRSPPDFSNVDLILM